MNEVRGFSPTVEAKQPAGRTTFDPQTQSAEGDGSPAEVVAVVDLLRSARDAERALLSASVDVATKTAAQGRPDAFELVTGSNSLARGAAEVAELIRRVEAKVAARAKTQCSAGCSAGITP